ncbi:hypothetical protein LXL04_024214 [Taraxacum kok-saghyz]
MFKALAIPQLSFSPKHYSTQTHTVTSVKRTFSHIYQQCSLQKTLHHGKEAHAHMIVSGFKPTIFVTNCLIQMYIKCTNMEYAHKVFDRMPQRDTISWNAMVFGYAGIGLLSIAQEMFDSMPERDIVSWNTLISGYLHNGSCWKSLEVFTRIRRENVELDATTFAVVLKACLGLDDHTLGIQIHGLLIRLGFVHDVVAGSATVDMYAKCKKLNESITFFNEMPVKNWVSWSALIAGCVQNDEFLSGLKLFKNMQKEGLGVSQSTYASLFRSCAGLSSLQFGSQLHAHSLKMNFGSDSIVGTATLDMYAKCGQLSDSKKLFHTLSTHNLQSYNAIITGCVRGNQGFEALELFHNLRKMDLGFDDITLSGAFSACAVTKICEFGLQLHGLTIKSKFLISSNVCVQNAMLDMYGKCGALANARQVFDEMPTRDAVSWNTIIAAYEQNGNVHETLQLLVQMLTSRFEPDEFTFGSVLKGCSSLKTLIHGMEVHARIVKSGIGFESFVGSALVDMYSKCGKIENAKKLHEKMDHKTMVSWNAIISGFSIQQQSEESQKLFSKMLESGTKPDNFTFATILDTCANLATVSLGTQIHAQIIKQEMQSDVFISSTLVDMYSKCGNMQDSRKIFDKTLNKDFVTWNAMICGYSQHGHGHEALLVFESMKVNKIKPNHATFVSVLRACAHTHQIHTGLSYFNSMSTNYGLEPQLEHYSCMVDILGRSGKVNEALKVINDMPMEADDVIWRTLLGICKLQRNVEVAEVAARWLVKWDPQDSSAYVLLVNIYADVGMWEEVSKVRRKMRVVGLKKEPGCSWIEVKSELHMFVIGDKAHPRCNEIYEMLDELISEMRWLDDDPFEGWM